MPDYPIAESVDAANEQHYEVPAAFFDLVLGPQRKYSCCLYDSATSTLAEAEEAALTRDRRQCRNWPTGRTSSNSAAAGARCRCGWPATIPAARITAVSNSQSQRAFIMQQAQARGLTNLDVVTADMNAFAPAAAASTASSRWRCSSTWPTGAACWSASAAG